MKVTTKILAALATAALAVGCSSGGGGSTATDGGASTLTISGALSTGASGLSVNGKVSAKDNSSMAVDLGNLEIYAIAFTSPPVIDQAAVDPTTGAFTVELPGAKGASVTAIVRDTTDGGEVATIVFRDTTQTDLNGDPKDSSSVVLSDSVTLGNLEIGDDGEIIVNVSDIADKVAEEAASGSAFDMSGSWSASAFSPLPAGYLTTAPADACPDGDCAGLPEGADIALVRIAGKAFTPNSGSCDMDASTVTCAESDGTVGSADKYALQVWDANGFAACGSKTGFSEAEARAGGGIHPSALTYPGAAFGDLTSFNPYFWVIEDAESPYPIADCRGIDVTVNSKVVKAYACKGDRLLNSNNSDTGVDAWQVSLGNGGCFDANNKPVRVTDWAGIGSPVGECTNSSTGLPAGFNAGECSYNADPDGSGSKYPAEIAFTCRWSGGQFEDASDAPNLSSPINSSIHRVGPPKMLSGSCGDQANGSGDGLTLEEARCYANAYYSSSSRPDGGGCAPDVRFNWGAQTVEDFYRVDYRAKPRAQFMLDILTYDASGALATINTEEREGFTISSGENSSVSCEVVRRITANFKKVTDTTAVMDLRFTGRMASTSAACQAVAKEALANAAWLADNPDATEEEKNERRAVDTADLEYTLVEQKMIFNLTKN